MANNLTLQHKRSSIASNAPATTDIGVGELAINFADKKLFTKDGTNAIIELDGSAKWTDQTGGVSRADKIAVGAAAAPKVAVDVTGTVGQNVQTTTGAINVSTGQVFSMTVSAATTVSFTGTIPDSTTVVLKLTNGGSAIVTFTGVLFAGGTAPTLTAAGLDILTFFTADAGVSWVGSVFALDAQ